MPTYSQNHTYQNISLDLGETWTIVGTLNKDNQPLPIDANTMVFFRVANAKEIVLSLSLSVDMAIMDPTTASYRIVVPPSQQFAIPKLVPGMYRYELSALLTGGVVTIQAEGSCILNNTLTYQYRQLTV